jgi:hypothetical protein
MRPLFFRLLAAVGSSAVAQAQAPKFLREAAPQRTVQDVTLARIALPDTVGALSLSTTVARRADGRFVVGAIRLTRPGAMLAVFSASGAPEHFFASNGTGPQELQSVGALGMGRGDTLFAFDRTGSAVAVVDPTFRIASKVNMAGGRPPFTSLADGAIAGSRANPAAGAPIMVIARDGRPVLDLGRERILENGASGPGFEAASGESLKRGVATDVHGARVWTYRRNRLDLSEWDLSGKQVDRLIAAPAWFQPWTDLPSGPISGPEPPPPLGNGLQTDSLGRLWLYVIVANEPWKPGEPGSASTYADRYDTMVAVIDPARAEIVAARRFSEAIMPVSGCLCAARYNQHDGGRVSIDVLRLSLSAR